MCSSYVTQRGCSDPDSSSSLTNLVIQRRSMSTWMAQIRVDQDWTSHMTRYVTDQWTQDILLCFISFVLCFKTGVDSLKDFSSGWSVTQNFLNQFSDASGCHHIAPLLVLLVVSVVILMDGLNLRNRQHAQLLQCDILKQHSVVTTDIRAFCLETYFKKHLKQIMFCNIPMAHCLSRCVPSFYEKKHIYFVGWWGGP